MKLTKEQAQEIREATAKIAASGLTMEDLEHGMRALADGFMALSAGFTHFAEMFRVVGEYDEKESDHVGG